MTTIIRNSKSKGLKQIKVYFFFPTQYLGQAAWWSQSSLHLAFLQSVEFAPVIMARAAFLNNHVPVAERERSGRVCIAFHAYPAHGQAWLKGSLGKDLGRTSCTQIRLIFLWKKGRMISVYATPVIFLYLMRWEVFKWDIRVTYPHTTLCTRKHQHSWALQEVTSEDLFRIVHFHLTYGCEVSI